MTYIPFCGRGSSSWYCIASGLQLPGLHNVESIDFWAGGESGNLFGMQVENYKGGKCKRAIGWKVWDRKSWEMDISSIRPCYKPILGLLGEIPAQVGGKRACRSQGIKHISLFRCIATLINAASLRVSLLNFNIKLIGLGALEG